LSAETSGAGPAEYVTRFAAFWSAPSPQRLDEVLGDRVRLVTPMTPTSEGLEPARAAFAEIFELITGLTGEVRRWGATEDGVLIELALSGDLGGRPITLVTVDRIVIGEDGRATERVAHFDPTPLVLAALLRPRAWPAFARSRLRRLRS
jgi:hypothetical protein